MHLGQVTAKKINNSFLFRQLQLVKSIITWQYLFHGTACLLPMKIILEKIYEKDVQKSDWHKPGQWRCGSRYLFQNTNFCIPFWFKIIYTKCQFLPFLIPLRWGCCWFEASKWDGIKWKNKNIFDKFWMFHVRVSFVSRNGLSLWAKIH